jgi:hypothetical protein
VVLGGRFDANSLGFTRNSAASAPQLLRKRAEREIMTVFPKKIDLFGAPNLAFRVSLSEF